MKRKSILFNQKTLQNEEAVWRYIHPDVWYDALIWYWLIRRSPYAFLPKEPLVYSVQKKQTASLFTPDALLKTWKQRRHSFGFPPCRRKESTWVPRKAHESSVSLTSGFQGFFITPLCCDPSRDARLCLTTKAPAVTAGLSLYQVFCAAAAE